MATRRHVLAGLLASTLPRLSWADAGSPAFLAAARDAEGRFALHGLTEAGGSLFAIPLPARGHAAAAHPHRAEAVAFARRPGTYALVIDCATGRSRARLAPPEGHQFNGHGAYSADGSVLYTSEVWAESSEGRIGVWDTAGWHRLTTFASQGIGPHEVRRLPGTEVLVVANGGIRTDPQDRTKLNIDTMRPNLSYLSPEGALLDQVELAPEMHQASIRHLALAEGETVAFAMQWEGDPAEPVPLLGLHRRGEAVRLCPPKDEDLLAMKGYAGSIARSAGLIALTSPRGGVVQLHAADGRPLATHARPDACGVAATGGGFVVTDGGGTVTGLTAEGFRPLARTVLAWDNHLVRI
ncbi:DUF1513 domain-containing protein [Cereibacter sphaeroides]|uniref:DUF1513 domain-containing protein n=1 Tax=Cereibacter sphaeroides TaxID=1063 RepID=UPI001F1C8C54|nr:DUF1513 domain-containing protein [Cereibacter sphaeroides]MCE6951258.1 DUF1513 domain-containing protein [Cereibacter sphaeroides]